MFFTWCQAHLDGSDSDDNDDNPNEDNDDDNHGDPNEDPDDEDDDHGDDYEDDDDDDDDEDDYKDDNEDDDNEDDNDDDDDDDHEGDNDDNDGDDNEGDNDDDDDDLDQVIKGENREEEGPSFSFRSKELLFVFVFLCSVLFPFYFHGVISSLIYTYLTFINLSNHFFYLTDFLSNTVYVQCELQEAREGNHCENLR